MKHLGVAVGSTQIEAIRSVLWFQSSSRYKHDRTNFETIKNGGYLPRDFEIPCCLKLSNDIKDFRTELINFVNKFRVEIDYII